MKIIRSHPKIQPNMTWTIGEIKRNLIRIFLTKCRIKKLFCVFFIKNISLNMLFLPCLIDLLDVLLVIGVNHISLLKNFLSSLSCGHCGPSPGNNESAGKRKSCHITKGNPYLKNMLCEIAWVIAGKRNAYLANWYWRLKSQKGAKRATIALLEKFSPLFLTC